MVSIQWYVSFSGVGFKPRNAIRAQPTWNATWKQYPITYKTDNNKMQMSVRSPEFENLFTEFFERFMLFVVCIKISNKTNNKMQISVRSLELIFTETDWPATERQLEVSTQYWPKKRLESEKEFDPDILANSNDCILGESEGVGQIASRPLATRGKHSNQYCNCWC